MIRRLTTDQMEKLKIKLLSDHNTAGQCRLIRNQRYRTDPDAGIPIAGLKKFTTGRNADDGLTFFWHSGILAVYTCRVFLFSPSYSFIKPGCRTVRHLIIPVPE
jgi:hypothetical protein